MLVNIANFTEAERYTATADAALPLAGIHKIVNNAGARHALPLADADAALLVEGSYGLSFKVSTDPYQVSRSTAPDFTGIRLVSIASGDLFVSVTDAMVEIDPSLLDASLDPARGGTLPSATDKLAIKGGLLCAESVVGAITTPVIARVHKVEGGMVVVNLLDAPAA